MRTKSHYQTSEDLLHYSLSLSFFLITSGICGFFFFLALINYNIYEPDIIKCIIFREMQNNLLDKQKNGTLHRNISC